MSDDMSGDWDETKTRPGRSWRMVAEQRPIPGFTVLAHPDPERVGEQALLHELLERRECLLSRLEPMFAPWAGGRAKPLADPHLSRRPLRLVPEAAGGVTLDCRSSGTRIVVGGGVVAGERTLSAAELDRGVVLLLAENIVLLFHRLLEIAELANHPTLVGESPAMVQLRDEIERVSDLNVPVLLRGETGTGKELVARAIHDGGPRSQGAYLGVNMGAIPTTLAAAELFGAARGAFTGAERRRSGYFQRADGGTLLLDEIGATPPEIQVMLLRVLETCQVELVGESQPQEIDVRVLAATDANLEAAIEKGKFSAPLLYRLSSYEISVPPLRERREDFGRLFYYFLRKELQAIGEEHRLDRPQRGSRGWLPAALVARMADFTWPGNVRQLLNVTRQLVIASRGGDQVRLTSQVENLLAEADAPLSSAPPPPPAAPAVEPVAPRPSYRDPQEVGQEELLDALRSNRWRLKPTAQDLGVSRTSLYALVDRCPQVRKAKDLTRQEVEKALERSGGQLETMIDELEVSRDALLRRMKELGLR